MGWRLETTPRSNKTPGFGSCWASWSSEIGSTRKTLRDFNPPLYYPVDWCHMAFFSWHVPRYWASEFRCAGWIRSYFDTWAEDTNLCRSCLGAWVSSHTKSNLVLPQSESIHRIYFSWIELPDGYLAMCTSRKSLGIAERTLLWERMGCVSSTWTLATRCRAIVIRREHLCVRSRPVWINFGLQTVWRFDEDNTWRN